MSKCGEIIQEMALGLPLAENGVARDIYFIAK